MTTTTVGASDLYMYDVAPNNDIKNDLWMNPKQSSSVEPRILHEMYSTETNYSNFDDCLDEGVINSFETFEVNSILRDLHNRSQRLPSEEEETNTTRTSTRASKRQKTVDLKPVAFVRFRTSRGKPKPVMLKALFDSGATGTLIAKKHCKKLKTVATAKQQWSTPAGILTTRSKVKAEFCISELHDKRVIAWNCHAFENLGNYDMIIGRDLMHDLGIDVCFSTQTINWDGYELPMRSGDITLEQEIFLQQEPDHVEDAAGRMRGILDAKYEAADLDEVVEQADHLDDDQRVKLKQLLTKHQKLFDGSLGVWKDATYNIDLKPGAEPYHARAFPIPKIHEKTLKMEVERLCELGVLKRVSRSEWGAPTFIIPKKDGTVRFISDFRELNKRIRRKPFPIPKIQDMLLNLEGFQYATKSMPMEKEVSEQSKHISRR